MNKQAEGELKKRIRDHAITGEEIHRLIHLSDEGAKVKIDNFMNLEGIFKILDKVAESCPFNIYFDNAIGGENHYSFHLKNKPGSYPSDTDEITREIAEWIERWFFGIKEKKGLYLVNRSETKTGKPSSATKHTKSKKQKSQNNRI